MKIIKKALRLNDETNSQVLGSFPEAWDVFGRGEIRKSDVGLIIKDCTAILKDRILSDIELHFTARALAGASKVGIWSAIRVQDRYTRYVVGLRGGKDGRNDVYIARLMPDGGDVFLGQAPLEWEPKVGDWYQVHVFCKSNRFLVYLNDEQLPRLDVYDLHAVFDNGSIGLGGGWIPTEYKDLVAKELSTQTQ